MALDLVQSEDWVPQPYVLTDAKGNFVSFHMQGNPWGVPKEAVPIDRADYLKWLAGDVKRFRYIKGKLLPKLGLVLALLLSLGGPTLAQTQQTPGPMPVVVSDASGSVTVTNTFQEVFPETSRNPSSGPYRPGCVIANTGVNPMWVYEGAVAGATKAKSFPLSAAIAAGQAGGVYRCADGATAAASQISITGTAGDTFMANAGGGGYLQNLNQIPAYAQGTTTSGQSGPLIQGAATTAVPAYVNNTTNPISITTGGELRVKLDSTTPGQIDIEQVRGQTAQTGGINGTLGVGGTAATNTNLSTATNPLVVAGEDYGGTPKIQIPKVDSSGNAYVNLSQVGGTATPVGHGLAATALRVELPTDGTGVVGLNAGSNIVGSVSINQTTPGNTNGTTIAPTSATAAGITSVVTGSALGTSVLKAGAGVLYSVYAQNLTSTSGFLAITNTTSAPGDGAITPLDCVVLPGNGFAEINYRPGPTKVYSTGITAVLTSATTCYTKTTGTITGFISGDVQ